MSDGVQSGAESAHDSGDLRSMSLAGESNKTVASSIGQISADDIRRMNNQKLMHGLTDQRAAILNYMWVKAAAEDWHAVADAAMDLREIDAKLSVLRG